MNDIDKKWEALVLKLEARFDDEMTLKGILYLIGVQELNMGIKRFGREEKLNILHVAVCKILTPFGFYKFDRIDNDGWPHWIELKALKNLDEKKQGLLMKEAIITHLNN
ncbi:hypothetical protein OAK24_00850 [Flavobacteriales bacterium]|nr:hypothetical protein [Flavobacteriales bacterium]